MRQNYTRQRQGRDFSLLDEVNHLRNAEMSVEGNYNQIDGILGNNDPKPPSPSSVADWGGKDDYEAKTMREQLEYYKTQVERNTAPVDGREPSPERGL